MPPPGRAQRVKVSKHSVKSKLRPHTQGRFFILGHETLDKSSPDTLTADQLKDTGVEVGGGVLAYQNLLVS